MDRKKKKWVGHFHGKRPRLTPNREERENKRGQKVVEIQCYEFIVAKEKVFLKYYFILN